MLRQITEFQFFEIIKFFKSLDPKTAFLYFAGFYIDYFGHPILILTLCTCFFGEILLKFVYSAFGFDVFLAKIGQNDA